MVEELVRRLRISWSVSVAMSDMVPEERIMESIRFFEERGLRGGEPLHVPEEWYYDEVLGLLRPSDVVYDVGAGDLRFALLASRKVKRVYAVEVNPEILARALRIIGFRLPRNVVPICANALDIPLPEDVTTITILMITRTWQIPDEWRTRRIIYTSKAGVHVLEPR